MRLTAAICLFAIAVNTALAGVGSIVICHDKGDGRQLSLGCIDKVPEPCCRDTHREALPRSGDHDDCDRCIDSKLDASEQDDATRSIDRLAVKAPAALGEIPADPSPRLALQSHRIVFAPAQAPLPAFDAAQQFATTVAFRV